jgi:Aerotolerance regulator N-terminal/von Willebrand factor type A domain
VSFVHPGLLIAGLVAVGLPVLIHLLTRRRRKTVRWGAMRFLVEAYRRQKRRLRLEQFLLLAMRCLLIGLIGFGLARPIFGADGGDDARARTVVIAIDNSLAASAVDSGGVSALERHKDAARAVLAGLDSMRGDRVGLVTLGGPAKGVVMPPSGDIGSVLRSIDEMEAVDSAADIGGLVGLLGGLGEDEATVAILSEWRGGSVGAEGIVGEVGAGVRVVVSEPTVVGATNIGVVSVESPRSVLVRSGLGGADLSKPARVVLVRSGVGVSEAGLTRVVLFFDSGGVGESVEVGSSVVRWSAGQTEATATISVSGQAFASAGLFGVLRAEIDEDAVAGDNLGRAPVELRDQLRVAVIAPGRFGRTVGVDQFGARDWVRLALTPTGESEAGLQFVEIDPGGLDRARVLGLDAAIVLRPDLVRADGWEVLRTLADKGGLVLVAAAPDDEVVDWGEGFVDAFGLGWTVGREALELAGSPTLAEPGGAGASLLGVLGGELSYLVEAVHVSRVLGVEGAADEQVVLRASTGEAVLLSSAVGSGTVAFFTVAIDVGWTDLPVKPLMVPLMQELVRQGVAQGSTGRLMIAGGVYDGGGDVAELAPMSGGASLRVNGGGIGIRSGGVWRALDEDGGFEGMLVVNANAMGGDVSLRSAEQVGIRLQAVVGDGEIAMVDAQALAGVLSAGAADDQSRADGPGWIGLMGVGLLGLFEMFFARLVSHAGIQGGVRA